MMTDANIRREVLRNLIATAYEKPQRFADAVSKPASQINDMLADPPRKTFGDKIARQFEKKLGLPTFFFEDAANAKLTELQISVGSALPASSPEGARYMPQLTDEEWLIINGYRSASKERRKIMLEIASTALSDQKRGAKTKPIQDMTSDLLESIGVTRPTNSQQKTHK